MTNPIAIKERDVLIQCKALLEEIKSIGWLDYWRISTGGKLRGGFKTKNTEMVGFSDIMVLFKYSTAVAFIELKATNGIQSDEQSEFQKRVELMGHKYYLCKSRSELCEILIKNGVHASICGR